MVLPWFLAPALPDVVADRDAQVAGFPADRAAPRAMPQGVVEHLRGRVGHGDLLEREPSGKDLRIHLPPKAFSLLPHRVNNADRLVTHNDLMNNVWPDTFVQPEVLASHIRDIRAALRDDARQPRFIETLARRGYRFIAKTVGSDTAAAEQSIDLAGGRLVWRDSPFSKLEQSYHERFHHKV